MACAIVTLKPVPAVLLEALNWDATNEHSGELQDHEAVLI